MQPAVIIQKKRDGKELEESEIRYMIEGLSNGSVADYQASAFLMAVYFKGMTPAETATLTRAMLESGDRYQFPDIHAPKVDKHSTGGIGDKVSLILAPLAAACGVVVPMMAGRGLGHTGGTLDKLEAIPGFSCEMTKERFKEILKRTGCGMIGQTASVAPADKKLYALRDVTATVECIPLIVGSILSKKLAEGTETLVLDIKVGNGAFMKTRESAKRLAKALVSVAKKMGVGCRAILTDMNQPLGTHVGNTLEVLECIEMMKSGTGAPDLKEITITLCAHMLESSKAVKTLAQGRKLATERLMDGSAWRKFQEMVDFQGGSLKHLNDTSLFEKAPQIVEFKAHKKGFITQFQTEEIGRMVVDLGGGRKKADDKIDFTVGFVFQKKLGSKVAVGETIAVAHLPRHVNASEWEKKFQSLVEIKAQRKTVPKLMMDVIT